MQSCKLDILLNTGGEIFKPDTIRRAGARILNARMGRLPEFRGINVLEWSLFHDQQPGVTLHLINEGIDTGETLHVEPIPIQRGDRQDDLRAKAIQTSVDLGGALMSLSHTEKGEKHLKEALRLKPGHAEAQKLLAKAWEMSGYE